jgi:hypothetical protein
MNNEDRGNNGRIDNYTWTFVISGLPYVIPFV